MIDNQIELEAWLYQQRKEQYAKRNVNLANISFEQWLICRGLFDDVPQVGTEHNKLVEVAANE